MARRDLRAGQRCGEFHRRVAGGISRRIIWLCSVPDVVCAAPGIIVLSFEGRVFLRAKPVGVVANERIQKRAHWLLMDISGTLAAYIRAQITACLVIGAVMMIGLTLIGAPYPVVLGAIAGLLEFILLVGPLLAAVTIFG